MMLKKIGPYISKRSHATPQNNLGTVKRALMNFTGVIGSTISEFLFIDVEVSYS
jgi:hypothetical protein